MVKEDDERIDVGPTASAPRNDLVWDDRDGVFGVMQRPVRLNDERKWQFGLLQERVRSGDGIKGRSYVLRGTVRIRGGENTCLANE